MQGRTEHFSDHEPILIFMKEIIHLQVGQCGNQIYTDATKVPRNKFVDKLLDIDRDIRLDNLSVYYNEMKTKYIPRAILVDLHPGTVDAIRVGPCGNLFKPDNYVFSAPGAGGNWAKGISTEIPEMMESVYDIIRREAEACDSLQGFQVVHSIGGTVGSGLGSYYLSKMRETYPEKLICTFSVMPSPLVSDTVVEPYNATLAVHQLVENVDQVMCIDNEALSKICCNKFKIRYPKYDDMNKIVADVMSGVTCSMRFPSGQLNSDLRRMSINLVPFSRLHFFLLSYAPLGCPSSALSDLIVQMLDPSNMLTACDPRHGRYLTAYAMFRGNLNVLEIEEQMSLVQNKNSSYFVEWIPDNLKSSLCTVPPSTSETSATLVSNNTSIQELFKRIHTQFTAMFNRKAFLHWYEDLDPMDFSEAGSNMADLINEYQLYQETPDQDIEIEE